MGRVCDVKVDACDVGAPGSVRVPSLRKPNFVYTPVGFSSAKFPSTTLVSTKPSAITEDGVPIRFRALGTDVVIGPIPLCETARLVVSKSKAHTTKVCRILMKTPFLL